MGTRNDARKRHTKKREDTERRRNKVETSRTWIYDKGLPIGGAGMNRYLGPESWVPTRVSGPRRFPAMH
jgi:hypothetical protein